MVNGEERVIYRVIRPVYEGALKDLKQGTTPNGEPLDGLIVYDLDRLTRDQVNLRDAIDVVVHHGKLISDINLTLDLFTEIGQGNAMFLVTAKSLSSGDTSRRVADKHERIAIAGIPVGGSRPFGWNEDKRTLHPVESALLRKARADVLAGVGLHTICREWNHAGIRTPRGKEWVRTVLRNVLLSPRLAGYRVYQGGICLDHDGIPVMGQYTPIFEIAEWEDVRDHLTRDGRYAAEVHRGGLKYLLSSIVRCGLCGAKCLAFGDRRNDIDYYSCPSPTTSRGCGKVSINGTKLDAMVTDRVLAYLSGIDIRTELEPWPQDAALAAKEAKIQQLMDAYNADELTSEDVFPAVAKLRHQADSLRRDRMRWNRAQAETSQASASVVELWPDLSVDRRRAVIATVVHTVAIGKRTIRQTRFDPEPRDDSHAGGRIVRSGVCGVIHTCA